MLAAVFWAADFLEADFAAAGFLAADLLVAGLALAVLRVPVFANTPALAGAAFLLPLLAAVRAGALGLAGFLRALAASD